MLFKWLPWRWIIRRAARSFGMLDPAMVLARIRSFAEPSEVHEPPEIVRAWVLFHARGVINTRAIQHNLDWVWPYWVERQFDPRDPSFIPRSYAISHINMTHRNWTAVGLPDLPLYPLADPRGLITPLYDGWSLDFWMLGGDGSELLPSRARQVEQRYLEDEPMTLLTRVSGDGLSLESRLRMEWADGEPQALVEVKASSPSGGRLVASLRPYNPEGVQFIDRVEVLEDEAGWLVNGESQIRLTRPERLLASTYSDGDVFHRLDEAKAPASARCRVGMATAAAVYPLQPERPGEIRARVPLGAHLRKVVPRRVRHEPGGDWASTMAGTAGLRLPDERFERLFRDAARTLLLLAPDEIYPGPYVYRRFWYRDAAFMLNALTAVNQVARAGRVIAERFPERQRASGFYESQEGEWDSNGEVLWIAERWSRLSGEPLPEALLDSLERGASWLRGKRIRAPGSPYDGLLPPGFSAEHLGPNNYFYWDDFWGLGGLEAAAALFTRSGREGAARACREAAEDFRAAIGRSIESIPQRRGGGAIPAAPNRRLDAGAVGSLAAGYPLQLYAPGHPPLMRTAEHLLEHCLVKGGFFQDMTHSGINPYLSLHLAQVLLRAGDPRYRGLVETVAELASSTGQWPEAVHPATGGGCMGDGQHGWAAAEWALMMRSLFLREEGETLVLGSGLFPEWLEAGEPLAFGPTPTPWGPVRVLVEPSGEGPGLRLEAEWRGEPPPLAVRVPGFRESAADPSGATLHLEPAR